MIKSIQSNKALLSGQLHRIVVNKQQSKEEFGTLRRRNSIKNHMKESLIFQKTNNNFNSRNSIDSLEQAFRVDTSKKIKSPVVVIQNRKLFVSSRNSRKSHQSQEVGKQNSAAQKPMECGYRIVVNRSSRVPTQMVEQEMSKDPETFTDYVEKIYGKEWFVY